MNEIDPLPTREEFSKLLTDSMLKRLSFSREELSMAQLSEDSEKLSAYAAELNDLEVQVQEQLALWDATSNDEEKAQIVGSVKLKNRTE